MSTTLYSYFSLTLILHDDHNLEDARITMNFQDSKTKKVN